MEAALSINDGRALLAVKALLTSRHGRHNATVAPGCVGRIDGRTEWDPVEWVGMIVRVQQAGAVTRCVCVRSPFFRFHGSCTSSLLDRRLLVDGEEIALFLQSDAIRAAFMRVVGRCQTANFPATAVT